MKSVLITGCSSGFGREMVTDFLRAGWKVYASMRKSSERSSIFENELKAHQDRLRILELDITNSGDREKAHELVDRECPNGLDCLINNAGYGLFSALEDISEEQLRHQMEVNFFGLALMTQAMLPALRRARGRIINLSSVLGFSGFPLTSVYCASKFAVEGLSESLRLELAPHGVQVALVEPGGHRTQFASQVVWGERSFSASSPYLAASKGYARFKDSLSKRPNPATASSVSRSVVALAGRSRMPARVLCGKDAFFMSFLRQNKLLSKIAEVLLHMMYRKKFLGGGV